MVLKTGLSNRSGRRTIFAAKLLKAGGHLAITSKPTKNWNKSHRATRSLFTPDKVWIKISPP